MTPAITLGVGVDEIHGINTPGATIHKCKSHMYWIGCDERKPASWVPFGKNSL